jgi:hypothetical protein
MDPVWVIESMLERDPDSPEAYRVWWESQSFWGDWTEADWHAALQESGRAYRQLIAQIEAAWGPPEQRNPSGDEIGNVDPEDLDLSEEDLDAWPPVSSTYWIRDDKRVCIWEEKQDVELPFTVCIAVVWDD